MLRQHWYTEASLACNDHTLVEEGSQKCCSFIAMHGHTRGIEEEQGGFLLLQRVLEILIR